jgi:type III pantothenate kinase
MNLIFDFGNSSQKMALFANGQVIHIVNKEKIGISDIEAVERQFMPITQVILSSVVRHDNTIDDYLSQKYPFFLHPNAQTPIPLTIAYMSPDTLGTDRLACAVAARQLFADQHTLILQLGSCLTVDFVDADGCYWGGSISPGLQMRCKSLHDFSANLPWVTPKPIDFWLGDTTENSILSGVINGMIAECHAMIEYYEKKYKNLEVVLTGGDASFFEHAIKYKVRPFKNFVMIGLDIILNYNVEAKTEK